MTHFTAFFSSFFKQCQCSNLIVQHLKFYRDSVDVGTLLQVYLI